MQKKESSFQLHIVFDNFFKEEILSKAYLQELKKIKTGGITKPIKNDETTIILKIDSIEMVKNQALNCFSGKQIPCDIDSVCVHGDGKSAGGTAKEIRDGLVKTGVTLRPLDQLKKFA